MHEACNISIQWRNILLRRIQLQCRLSEVSSYVSKPSLRFALDLRQGGPRVSPFRFETSEIQTDAITLFEAQLRVGGVLKDFERPLLLGDYIVKRWTDVEAAAGRTSRRVRGEEDEGEDDEGNDDAAAVGHPSLGRAMADSRCSLKR
jgi:hypothetical protein